MYTWAQIEVLQQAQLKGTFGINEQLLAKKGSEREQVSCLLTIWGLERLISPAMYHALHLEGGFARQMEGYL